MLDDIHTTKYRSNLDRSVALRKCFDRSQFAFERSLIQIAFDSISNRSNLPRNSRVGTTAFNSAIYVRAQLSLVHETSNFTCAKHNVNEQNLLVLASALNSAQLPCRLIRHWKVPTFELDLKSHMMTIAYTRTRIMYRRA